MIFGDTDFNDCEEPYDDSKCYCFLKEVMKVVTVLPIPEHCPICNKILSGKHRKNVRSKVNYLGKRKKRFT